MPTTVNGSNKRLTANGTATSEGLLTRSTDGNYLIATGYDAAVGTASPNATPATAINRVIGRIDSAGNVDTTTALTDAATASNPRSAVSTNGTDMWISGGAGGPRYTTLGSTSSTQISTTTTNLRQLNIFNGQLYVTSMSGVTRMATIGTGTPTTSGQTITNLTGLDSTNVNGPYGFFFADLNAGVAGNDTLYIADDSSNIIRKFSLVSGTWTANGSVALTGVRGITGSVSGTTVTLYMSSNSTTISTLSDASGYNATITGSPSTVVTAGTNKAFRGIAFAPGAGAGTPTPSPSVSPTPTLSINDVSQDEGNAGTTNFNFTVSLSSPAQTGGVSFTVNTANGTTNPATAGSDYTAIVNGAGSIPEGSSSTQVTVQVSGDLTQETNETFFVNISNVTGAGVTDGQGQGTIQNDDITLTPIHDIQGNGNSSPLVGQSVTTTGIVTGRKTNGFFIQEPDATVDADPNTSEGMFVFTSSAPSAGINVGDSVRVTATVAEFISATSDEPVTISDPKTATELTSPTTTILSSGNPLPVPMTEAIFTSAAASRSAELEKYEYMRVSVSSLTVTEPTNNNFGEFWGVTTGTPRPFRETGIESGDPIPAADQGAFAGTQPPNIPIFDGNFERIMIDSDEATNTSNTRRSALFVTTGAVITGIVGPLDYSFDNYRVVLDFGATTNVTPGITAAIPIPTPAASEFTISHANLENFSSSNATKLSKASLAIRNVLHTPDVVGLIEIDTSTSAQALANKINADVGNPSAVNYVVYFNDTAATQDIGYLVNTARVPAPAAPTPYHPASTFTYCGVTDTLHDRPSLVLNVDFPQPGGGTVPVTIILNHTKSLIAVDSQKSYGTCGTGTEGARNREKRRQQAEDIADLIALHISENLVVLGDMNAFDFNDGFQDMVGTLKGSPAPADQVVEPSTDRWSYSLTNLVSTLPADQRYSFAFEGNAQALDHVLVNSAMLQRNTRYAYARYNGDFSNDYSTNANTPERVADHDAPVAFFNTTLADVSINKTLDTSGPYYAGQPISYTLNVANAGPDTATNIQVTDTPTNLTITNVSGSGCTALPCTITSLASNANTNITVSATIGAAGAFDNSASATAAESDPAPANNTDNTGNSGTASAAADVSITKTLDTSGPYSAGQAITYTLNVANAGPSTATNIQVTDTPSNLTITNVTGGGCSALPCTITSLAANANTNITVSATIDGVGAFDNTASATATEFDPTTSNNSDSTGNGGTTLPTLSIDDVTHAEGNTGTTSYVFTVTKTGAGATSVQFATANGSATILDNDYQANSGTLEFASDDTAKQITVLVNGDTASEPNENFAVNLSSPSAATITDASGQGNITNDDEAASAGQLIISEFRFRGPGGTPPSTIPNQAKLKADYFTADNSATDEFVELYNNTDSDITVSTTDASSGWALVASDGAARFTIPNGIIIRARGHYLGVNSTGYSLASYPAGSGTTATGDATYTADIPDGSGIALFRTSNPANFTLAQRLDAAGYAGVDSLYREGNGFPTGGAESGGVLDYSFVRSMKNATNGLPKDTGDNAADFIGVSTTAAVTGQGSYLGAPGPENLSSPINRNSQFSVELIEPQSPSSSAPNRVRDVTPILPNAPYGTLSIRRRFTNNTGQPVSRLRFRIVEVTTLTTPPVPGQADLRALTSNDFAVTTSRGPLTVHGTTLEQPPTQSSGGGWNSSLNVPSVSGNVILFTPDTGTITLNAPIENGGSIDVQFLLGVMQTGTFRFYVDIEADTGCTVVALAPCVSTAQPAARVKPF